MCSLKAKLRACVGKYRTTLARLPRQKLMNPCSAVTRVKQLTMPARSRPRSAIQMGGQVAGQLALPAEGMACMKCHLFMQAY